MRSSTKLLLGSMIQGSVHSLVTQEMCMMDHEDRLECSLNPEITRNECLQLDCCFDSHVPAGTPHCYFAMMEEDEDVTDEAELLAIPLAQASGSYRPPQEEEEEEAEQLVEKAVFLGEQELTCDINVKEATRCGRRGVPKTQCERIGCCWNLAWVPGGSEGPRCFKKEVADAEHSYNNGKREEAFEDLPAHLRVPLEPEEQTPSSVADFLVQNLAAKKAHLAEHSCVPNHSQLMCLQGVEEREKCDIKEALDLGIPACNACIDQGCCFDPEPKIMNGQIYPLCFRRGPIDEDLAADFDIGLTTEIPPIDDNEFFDLINMLENARGGEDSEDTPVEAEPVEETPEERERRLRFERWQEIQGKLGMVDDVRGEIGMGELNNPSSLIQFTGHPNLPGAGNDFRQQQKSVDQIVNELEKQREVDLRDMLPQRTVAEGWQTPDRQSAALNLKDLINEIGEDQKTSPATRPTTTTTTTTTTRVMPTRPVISNNPVEAYKMQLVNQYVQSKKSQLIREGYRGDQLNAELAKWQSTYEARFGVAKPTNMPLVPSSIAVTTTTSTTTTTTTQSPINQQKQLLETKLEQMRAFLISQGYNGEALDLEMSRQRNLFSKALGITPDTTMSTTTTTTKAPTPPPGMELPTQSDDKCWPEECGNPVELNANLKKIVGGVDAGSIKYWPWQASLRRSYTDEPSFLHHCGATLIQKQWILTAAHCFIRYKRKREIDTRMMEPDSSRFLVHLGRYDKNSFEMNMQPRALSYFVAHPGFQPWVGNQQHDIALARLHKPVEITSYVKPACLPKFVPPVDGKLYITGWGSTKSVGPSSQRLKEIVLPLASQETCRDEWRGYFNDGWICTDPGLNEDACQGDSGGPAVYFDQFSKSFAVVGVTIAGSDTCSTSSATVKAGVYSNVVHYRKFIDEVTQFGCR
ncbi:Oidioi.mRNA.OKI2018_I69.XSR.g14233.t1.cds [Oikopleura dioica]|uniref:Oidioi.mRNA.OKI2018_I69.XSR.g14233.t1.cds n=1 Tax=Oikopleura dioica TaxID=34765 RepID=A0ABN7S9A9_OIKDI|nr:Oidioi.mRNA.OKI2018_I69.XSR.g14233.t1.cds [Oikopleura dioica]